MKNTHYSTILLLAFVSLSIFFSCKKDEVKPVVAPVSGILSLNLPATPLQYEINDGPAHLLSALANHNNSPANNPITNDGATLGRVLFYDRLLSSNQTVSCSSCHLQENAFADPISVSEGFNGQFTRRNSMSLVNLIMYDREKMFWDERADNLEDQVLHPIQDPIEMGLTLETLVSRLEGTDYYAILFENAFGDSTITTDRVSKALSQFLRSMVSYQSKYDRVLTGDDVFTASEANGQVMYNTVGSQQGCVSCHGGDLVDADSYNFQIGQQPTIVGSNDLSDLGIFEITGNPSDSLRFKVSSLRNIELTAPYLHDGSVATLEDLFATGSPHNFGMNASQSADLIAFLKTLTDYEFIQDERFSSPFE